MAKVVPTAIVLLMTAIGIAGALVPLRPCGTCDGLALKTPEAPRVDCPDCSDRGKVSCFRSWIGPRIPEVLADVVRGSNALQSLKSAIERDGKNPETFIMEHGSVRPTLRPRFITEEGERYLVLLMGCPPFSPGDDPSATIMLFSMRGQLLDCIHLLCSNDGVELRGTVLETRSADGARITIDPDRDGLDFYSCYKLYHGREPVRLGFVAGKRDGLCRLAIREGRFEVLSPAAR
jgi:hypothetical protein